MPVERRRVSVVVPCRQEARHITTFLESVAAQDLSGIDCEVIIAEGCSTDGTREILSRLVRQYAWLKVIDNPAGIVSTGLNAAIQRASGDIIIRMDVHTEFAGDYILRCVETLEKTGAANVGGPWVAHGKTYVSRAIAAGFGSAFGSGGARGRQLEYEGPVDTVYLGCWRKDVFDRFGGFDERLVRNQDDEFNLRLTRGGATVWQSPAIVSRYAPRNSFKALFRQFFQYGFWKIPVIRKHSLPASPRHLVPGAFVLGLVFAPFLAWMLRQAGLPEIGAAIWMLWLLGSTAYAGALLLASAVSARRHGWELLPALPAVFAIYHVAYGSGFLVGLIYWSILQLAPGRSQDGLFTEITR